VSEPIPWGDAAARELIGASGIDAFALRIAAVQ
jgi:hypothetical protein